MNFSFVNGHRGKFDKNARNKSTPAFAKHTMINLRITILFKNEIYLCIFVYVSEILGFPFDIETVAKYGKRES